MKTNEIKLPDCAPDCIELLCQTLEFIQGLECTPETKKHENILLDQILVLGELIPTENQEDLVVAVAACEKVMKAEEFSEMNSRIGSTCQSCGESFPRAWQVRSCGPQEYTHEPVTHCAGCWHDSVRGDGHCYSGEFSVEKNAREHAAFMSGE